MKVRKAGKFMILLLVAAVALNPVAVVCPEETEATEDLTEGMGTAEEIPAGNADYSGGEEESEEILIVNDAEDRFSDAASEWQRYDDLIARIESGTDAREREALMHEAEDMLMGTGAIVPLYYYNDLDFTDTVPPDAIQEPLDSPELHIADRAGTCCVCFNVNSPLFEEKTPTQASTIRRALSLLIDRNYIAENVAAPGHQPANTFIPAGISDGRGGEFRANDEDYTYPCEEATGYYDPSLEVYDENLEKALLLLAEAGFEFDEDGTLSDETPLNIRYLVKAGSLQEKTAEVIQQDFAVIGVNVTIDRQKQKAFQNKRKKGNFDMIFGSREADFDDPVSLLQMWTSDSGRNSAGLGKQTDETGIKNKNNTEEKP